MKKLINFFVVVFVFSTTLTVSCKKEVENQPPTCKITSPDNGQEITEGETVTIAVDAIDSDGSIAEVRFYIDGVGKGSASSFPYNYDWNTTGETTGQHTIKATTIDNNGGEASKEITVTLIAGGYAPVADFTATPTSGTAPFSVNFTDQSTNTPTSWQWDFGDGNTSTQQNPSHTYNDAGTFAVTLTATNEYGSNTKTETDYIVVSAGGSSPVAAFSATPTNGTAPLSVNFTDQSINTPTSWQWDFGDGGSSTEQNPTHTYNTDGSYTVSLMVTNEYGSDTKTITGYIIVNSGGGAPVPDGYFTDARDGQEYGYKIIGSQTWMAENLNYETVNSWWYDNNSSNGDVYGRLYTWDAALTACPAGWHLPSDNEWKTMEMYLGMSQSEAEGMGWRGTDEGKKMKSTSGCFYNGNGTNSSGFTALPGGQHDSGGSSYDLGFYGYWWSSTEYSGTGARYRGLDCDHDDVYRDATDKTKGFSVRCLKN